MLDYETVVRRTNNYSQSVESLLVLGLALSGEVGEFANKLKKAHCQQVLQDDATKTVLLDELGDVQWYLTALIHHLGADLPLVMEQNAAKVSQRHATGQQYNSKVSK